MRKFKKIACLILCMAILVSGMYTVSAKDTFVPDAGAQTLIQSFGFFDNFSESYVTRREYIKAMLCADGHINPDDKVTDSALSEMGREAKLIGVYDDGKAGLDTLVTYGEVLAGAVYTLGYDITMDSGEKSLSGMMTMANRLGIGKGINKTEKANVTGNEFGEILYRMLITDAVEITGYTNDGVVADITEDRTLLEIYHNIYKAEGKVTANCRSALYDANGVGEGKVRIGDNLVAYTGDTDAEFYLGYEVDCYYKNKNGENTLVWIEKDSKCEELFLESHEIEGYSGKEYRYVENNKVKKARLSDDVSIIYNSVATGISKLSDKQIVPEVGEVSLINCDGTGGYDTVIIMDYESAICGGAIENEIVNSKGDIMLDTDTVEDYNIYDASYKEIKITSLIKGGIIWVAKSLDNSYASVLVSAESISGNIAKLSKRNEYTVVSIDGKEYRVSPKCDGGESISVGMGAEFYLDPSGAVAGYRAIASADMKLGYLYNAKDIGVFGNSVSMRIFDGTHKGIECADRVAVNGKNARTTEEILAPVKAEDGSITPQLIRFRTDSDGKLVEYETATTLVEGQEEADRLFTEAKTPTSDSGQPGLYYQAGYHYTVGNWFAFEATSKMFIIPADLTQQKDFQLTSPQNIGEQNMYGLTAYKTDSNYDYAIAGVWRDTAASVDKSIVSNDSPYVVLEISETIFDEEEAFNVKVAAASAVSDVVVMDEDIVEILKSGNIKKGDIIRFDQDANGKMITFKKDYDYDTHTIVSDAAAGFTAKYRLIAAEVTKKMNSSVKVKPTVPYTVPYVKEEQIIFGAYGATRVAVVDINRGDINVRSGSIADVNVGDKFVYMSRNGFTLFMYIIKD